MPRKRSLVVCATAVGGVVALFVGAALADSAEPRATTTAAEGSAVRSSVSDVTDGVPIDLKRVSVSESAQDLGIEVRTYGVVSRSTLESCGLVRISLGADATVTIRAGAHHGVRALVRDSGAVTARLAVHRPSAKAFRFSIARSDISSYGDRDTWSAFSVGGGSCSIAAHYDKVPDRGAIAP